MIETFLKGLMMTDEECPAAVRPVLHFHQID